MKLYYSPGACSLAAHIISIEGGLDLALEQVDLKSHRTESGADFFAINPKGYVPAVELDDGGLLTENTAILPFLGDRAGLMPEGMGRYRALEWIGYIASEIHKAFTPLFHGGSAEEKAEAKGEILLRLKFTEDSLSGDWLMGSDRPTPPDAYLFVILRWARTMHLDLSAMPRLVAFKARMESRPAVQKALKEEGLH